MGITKQMFRIYNDIIVKENLYIMTSDQRTITNLQVTYLVSTPVDS